MAYKIAIKGFRIKDGKVQRVASYGLDASARIRQNKSKRVRVKRKGQ